jgi:hypothetical protein
MTAVMVHVTNLIPWSGNPSCGDGDDDAGAASSKADWECAKCGKSNFGKRLLCYKCKAPQPGRVFTAAGVKGYEKRQLKRAEAQQKKKEGGGEKRKAEEAGAAGGEAPKKKSFGGDDAAAAADGATDKPAAGAASDWAWAGKSDTATAAANAPAPAGSATAAAAAAKKEKADAAKAAKPARKNVKSSDRGKPPKQLRDPTAPLVYLEQW